MWHITIDLYIVTCRLADFPCMVREVEVGFAHVDGQSTYKYIGNKIINFENILEIS